ncbi:MAG TPA: putative Ig domain-containing protein, partial [Cytophagales bacterium]
DADLPVNGLTYSLAGTVPAGAGIDAATGAFTWTPTETQGPGSYTFTVVVSDGALTYEEEITVTVGEVNLAPVLAGIGGKTTNEGATLSFTASAADADLPANALAFSLAAPATGTYPTGAAITAAGGFSWTPTETQGPGVYRVNVVVSDGTLTDEEEIEITVREVNTAPAFTSQPVLTVVEDTPYAYTVTAADGDSPANALTLAATGLPAWLTFNPATGVLSGTPGNAQVGMHPVVLTVTDGMLTVEQTFAIQVRNQNDAPEITVSAVANNVTVAEDQPLSVPFEVSDVDSPLSDLRVQATSGNAALVPASAISFAGTGSTRTVRFTPQPDTFGGPLTLTLEVSDGELTASTSFQVTVLPVNDAPTVNPVAEVELRINSPAQTLTLTGISAGPANESDQQLALSVQSDNPVMIPAADITYHGNGTATLRFTPAGSQTLTDPATLTVTLHDNGGTERGGEDTRQLRIPVRFLPTNNAVFMPNLFTPNGDLSNDRFTVLGEGIERITFRIFDRKGTVVYESRDVQEATTRGWDGTYRGQALPAGVYTWQIVGTFLDGSPLHYQGKKAGSVLLSR